MSRLATIFLVLASIAAGLDNRAETTEPAPDERLPTLHCLEVTDVAGAKEAQCELVNDTSLSFFFDGERKTSPDYSIEQRHTGRWTAPTPKHGPANTVKHLVAAGASVQFPATLPNTAEPVRLRLAVYRTNKGRPVAILSNPARLSTSVSGREDDDVPMILCADVSPPKAVHRVEPDYPVIAHRAGIHGTVVLEVVIDKAGNVQDARVVRSIPILDPAAVSALKQWKYDPARDRWGRRVAVYFRVSVRFELPPGVKPAADSEPAGPADGRAETVR